MSSRVIGFLTVGFVFAVNEIFAAPFAGEWKALEIVAFRDVDRLEVKLDGEIHKAFLAGLRPLRETVSNATERETIRNAMRDRLKKSDLSAQTVTRRGELLGLSIDAFSHKKHSFDHPWNPERYPYCWTGWGGYNFNTYFLHVRWASLQDNFGENTHWRDDFAKFLTKSQAVHKP